MERRVLERVLVLGEGLAREEFRAREPCGPVRLGSVRTLQELGARLHHCCGADLDVDDQQQPHLLLALTIRRRGGVAIISRCGRGS